jgi:hypothetical protein
MLSKKEFAGISKQRWFKIGSQCAILIQKFNCLNSFVSNYNSTSLLRRLFRQHRPEGEVAARPLFGRSREQSGRHLLLAASQHLNSDPLFKGAAGNKYNLSDAKPVFEVVESPGGLYIGARRNAEAGNYYWRITQWVLPSLTMILPRGGHSVHGHFWIPADDHNCWAWSYDYHPARDLTSAEREAMEQGKGIHAACVPGTYRPLANKDNDYLMDRAAQQRRETYSGIAGIAMQEASLQETMGPIIDRTKENLVSTYNGIIMARHCLLRAAKALVENGRYAARRRSRTPASTLGVGDPAAGAVIQGRCARGAHRAPGGRAGVGVSTIEERAPSSGRPALSTART